MNFLGTPGIKRFFYETMTMIPFVLGIVSATEVSAIKHVRYREGPLYYFCKQAALV